MAGALQQTAPINRNVLTLPNGVQIALGDWQDQPMVLDSIDQSSTVTRTYLDGLFKRDVQ